MIKKAYFVNIGSRIFHSLFAKEGRVRKRERRKKNKMNISFLIPVYSPYHNLLYFFLFICTNKHSPYFPFKVPSNIKFIVSRTIFTSTQVICIHVLRRENVVYFSAKQILIFAIQIQNDGILIRGKVFTLNR